MKQQQQEMQLLRGCNCFEDVSATDSVSTDSLARETDQLVSEEVSPETIMEGDSFFVGTTVYNGVDYSKVYNYQYYMQMNPDLASMFGTNTEEGANFGNQPFRKLWYE